MKEAKNKLDYEKTITDLLHHFAFYSNTPETWYPNISGISIKQVILECLTCGQGDTLDGIGRYLGVFRMYLQGDSLEVDASFRTRMEMYVSQTKIFDTLPNIQPDPNQTTLPNINPDTGVDYSFTLPPLTEDRDSYLFHMPTYGGYRGEFHGTYKPINEPVTIRIRECQHAWTEYQGLSERYDYCSKCDKRR